MERFVVVDKMVVVVGYCYCKRVAVVVAGKVVDIGFGIAVVDTFVEEAYYRVAWRRAGNPSVGSCRRGAVDVEMGADWGYLAGAYCRLARCG